MDEDHEDGTTEHHPLTGDASAGTQRTRRSLSITSSTSTIHSPKSRRSNRILWTIFAAAWIMSASSGFFNIPSTKIFEEILCRRFYDRSRSVDAPINEDMCKVDAVQSRLAYFFAVSGSLDAVAGAVSALPWGIVSDKIGRRPVFAIVALGHLAQMIWVAAVGWFEFGNLNLLWLSSLAVMIGGGGSVSAAMLYSIITDVLPASERAVGFMRMHVASIVGNLLAPTLVSALMPTLGPWPPLFFGLGLILCSGGLILLLPETKPQPQVSEDPAIIEGSDIKAQMVQVFGLFKDSVLILDSPSALLLASTCLVNHPILTSTMHFLNIFAPRRYHIHIAETGYIQTTYGLAHIFVLFVAMPFLSGYVLDPSTPRSRRISSERKRDLIFALGSYLISATGSLIMALSPILAGFVLGLMVFSFGSGQTSLVRSTLALYVDPEHRSQMFTLLSLVDMIAQLYSQPMLAGLFTEGMRLGGAWIGLPYLGTAGLCILASMALLFVKLPKIDQASAGHTREEYYGEDD